MRFFTYMILRSRSAIMKTEFDENARQPFLQAVFVKCEHSTHELKTVSAKAEISERNRKTDTAFRSMREINIPIFVSLLLVCNVSTAYCKAARAGDWNGLAGVYKHKPNVKQQVVLQMPRNQRKGSKSHGNIGRLILQVNQNVQGQHFSKKVERPPIEPECETGLQRCTTTSTCISEEQECDGVVDCPDGSDEIPCNQTVTESSTCSVGWLYTCDGDSCICDTTNCAEGFSLCNDSYRCIRTTQICDGFANCNDGLDESGCVAECDATHLQCGSTSQCVFRESFCDGYPHCSDKSDEESCDPCPPDRPYRCNNSSKCIKELFLCDGYKDCPNNDDEGNTTCSTCPSDRPIRCPSGECISTAWLCDLTAECSDGWDEANCATCPSTSPFRCNVTEKCLPLVWVCDGASDCSTSQQQDASDETQCNPCPQFKPHRCADGSACYPDNWKCNDEVDCRDGSDEENCFF